MASSVPLSPARGALLPLRRLAEPGARRWYVGAVTGLAYQAIEVAGVWSGGGTDGAKVAATLSLAVFYALYLLIPPLVQPEREPVRMAATMGLLLLSFLLFVPVGESAVWTWVLVLVVAAFSWSSPLASYGFVAVVAVLAVALAALRGWPDTIAAAPYITASVGVMMVAFAQQVRQTGRLRAANDEIARLAVEEERARFARDLHDSLGHSLTVVAVKSELAGKLVDRSPAAARAEIAEVERLARTALADLRASVAGVRSVTLDGELAAARTALAAVGVALEVPRPVSRVKPDLRPLLAWAVREGVTNVLRHAHATVCVITFGRSSVTIRNDGPAAPGGGSGSGLRGLAERAAAQGARLEAHPLPQGGFELTVGR